MFEKEFIEDEVNEIVNQVLPEYIELVNLEIKGKGSKKVLRVLIDKNTGGINLDECAEMNRKLSEVLDERGPFEKSYLLDVSSPGIDYPLKTIKDFKRNIGKEVSIEVFEEIEDKRKFIGKLIQTKENSVLLEENDKKIEVPIDNIKKAKQEI